MNRKTILWLVLFSISMAFLESAVVIYLRKIYYPDGFKLPIRPIEPAIALVEILREASTLVMLVAVAILSGKTKIQRLASFLICFGTWDLFYYLYLKLFLTWPASILDPDILFLIPVPWIGPVLAPVILSLTMILLAVFLIRKERTASVIRRKDIFLLITGSLIIIFSFTFRFQEYMVTTADAGKEHFSTNFPWYFWIMFGAGWLMIAITGIAAIKKKTT
ncbi:MAG: hypothetical protein NT126_12650 [Bacteroidetes bacterium]|nr:hypothetical protein [Bacteroidota bacterium]